MIEMAQTVSIDRRATTLIDRLTTLFALALAVALFQTVGWLAMKPDDPLGVVGVMGRHGGSTMLLQAAALAGVAAGLATIIAGRVLPDVGVLAAALGLALVSLRGSTVETLLLQRAEESTSPDRWLALRFTLEAAGWFFSILVAIAATAVVMRFCYSAGRREEAARSIAGEAKLAGFEAYDVWADRASPKARRFSALSRGAKHTLLAAGVGMVAMGVLSAGLYAREIRHGQVCFLVAASVVLGTYVASRVVPVRSALWGIVSVAVLSIGSYLWAAVRPDGVAGPIGIPVSHSLRILPLQFIAVGTVAALVTFWLVYLPTVEADDRRRRQPPASRREKKR